MTTSLTAAQAAQQFNRSADGRYGFTTHEEASGLELQAPGPEVLQDGERIDFGADPHAGITSYSLERHGDRFIASAELAPIDLRHQVAPNWVKPERIDEVLSGSRRHAAHRFIEETFGVSVTIDPNAPALLSITSQCHFEEQPAEDQLMQALWSKTSPVAHASGPGAIGDERLESQLSAHLDAQCHADVDLVGSDDSSLMFPDSWIDSVSEMSLEGEILLDDRTAVDIARGTEQSQRGPALDQLARFGYAQRAELAQEANALGGFRGLALEQWALNQEKTSDQMRGAMNPVFGPGRPAAARKADAELQTAALRLEDVDWGSARYASLRSAHRAAKLTRQQYGEYA